MTISLGSEKIAVGSRRAVSKSIVDDAWPIQQSSLDGLGVPADAATLAKVATITGPGPGQDIIAPIRGKCEVHLATLSRGCDHAPYSGALFISISSISRICTTSAATKRCAYSSSAIDLSLTISIKSR